MASINGISIKGLKQFADHEGAPCFQGNVYYRGKKLGFWSQDSWGGPDTFDFDESILDEEVKKWVASDMVEEKNKKISDLDCMLCDILELSDDEKSYKKGLKNGYNTYVTATDGYHFKGYYCISASKEEVESSEYYGKFIKKCKDTFFKDFVVSNRTVKIYRSLDDFRVKVA